MMMFITRSIISLLFHHICVVVYVSNKCFYVSFNDISIFYMAALVHTVSIIPAEALAADATRASAVMILTKRS